MRFALGRVGRERRAAVVDFEAVPLLARLPADVQRALARHVDIAVARPGLELLRAGRSVRWVSFVASGTAVVEGAHQRRRLGAGSMVGVVEALAKAPASATV